MRFSLGRRWETLAVAVVLGASGGSVLGLVTAPAGGDDDQRLAPAEQVAPSTTRRQRSRFAGVSSTTTRPRPRAIPAATAALSPATTSSTTTSTVRPTTTTVPRPTTTTEPSTTTTIGGETTTTSTTLAPSTTSTT